MSVIQQPLVAPLAAAPVSPPKVRSPWLVGPWFDLLCVSICVWPLIVLAVYLGGKGSQIHIKLTLYQLWLLSTPHRWITLPLVFADRKRFAERPRAFIGIALGSVLLVLCWWLSTGTIALLVAIDYIWNAWHFAAQHSGISRIYARVARPDVKTNGMFEKVLLRVFVLYVIFRMLGFPILQGEDVTYWLTWLRWLIMKVEFLDLYMLALPATLLLMELRDWRPQCLGRMIYLTSICSLYTGLLLFAHFHWDESAFAGLALTGGMFHATEYLAIVSMSSWKRHAASQQGVFAFLVRRWALALVIFMGVMGAVAVVLTQSYYGLMVTIMVSYIHYAYDGMIWKAPRPAGAPTPPVPVPAAA